MNNKNPLISVVTPTWNSSKTILGTLESIACQTYKEFEHIIIDNVSTDGTQEIIRDFYSKQNLSERLLLKSQPDSGISDAFNKGIALARGEIVMILNGDDSLFSPNVFEQVVTAFSDPTIDIVHGNMIFESSLGHELRRPLLTDCRIAMPINHPTMFTRASSYQLIGNYSESLRYVMDYEWLMRAQKKALILKYLDTTISTMSGLGISATHEFKTFQEIELALKKNDLWDGKSSLHLKMRRFRFQLKQLLFNLKINYPISLWRKLKFRKSDKHHSQKSNADHE